MKKFLITLGFVATIMMATAPMALAVEQLDPTFLPKGMPTLSGGKSQENFTFDRARITIVKRLLNVVAGSAAIIATFFVLYSGFNLVISHGEDDKMGPAKKGLTWALLGLVFIMLSYSIMSFVIKTAIEADDPDSVGERSSDQVNAANSNEATQREQQSQAERAATEQAINDAIAPDPAPDLAPQPDFNVIDGVQNDAPANSDAAGSV